MAFLALGAISAASWALGRFQHSHAEHPVPVLADGQQLNEGDCTPEHRPDGALDKEENDTYAGDDSVLRVSRLRARFDQHGALGRSGPVIGPSNLPKPPGAPGGRDVSVPFAGPDWEQLLREAVRLGAQTAAQAAVARGGAGQPVSRPEPPPPVVNVLLMNSAHAAADGQALQALAPETPRGDAKVEDTRRQKVPLRHHVQRLLLRGLTTVLIWEAAKHHVASRQPEPPLLAALNGVRQSVRPSRKPGILAAVLGRKPEPRFLGLF